MNPCYLVVAFFDFSFFIIKSLSFLKNLTEISCDGEFLAMVSRWTGEQVVRIDFMLAFTLVKNKEAPV